MSAKDILCTYFYKTNYSHLKKLNIFNQDSNYGNLGWLFKLINMKVYTIEQVKNFLKERTFIREETIDAMCDILSPIELPSDDEIEESSYKMSGDNVSSSSNFIIGAYWMKEQILNQNTKQHIINIMKADEDDELYDQNK